MRFVFRVLLRFLPSSIYLRLYYRYRLGEPLNLNSPRNFNEKLQYLKVYGFKPFHTDLADKIKVKDFVAKEIGDKYVIPTICEVKNQNELTEDFITQFIPCVIKTNHDCDSHLIVKTESDLSKLPAYRKRVKKKLSRNYYWMKRERQYKDIEPKLFIEKFIQARTSNELVDYKFYCFNGEPKFIQINSKSANNENRLDFFDIDWNLTPVTFAYPNSEITIPKPQRLDAMIDLAKVLSARFDFVRVDFYQPDDKIFFGEITMHPNSGLKHINPPEWNLRLGDMIHLSD